MVRLLAVVRPQVGRQTGRPRREGTLRGRSSFSARCSEAPWRESSRPNKKPRHWRSLTLPADLATKPKMLLRWPDMACLRCYAGRVSLQPWKPIGQPRGNARLPGPANAFAVVNPSSHHGLGIEFAGHAGAMRLWLAFRPTGKKWAWFRPCDHPWPGPVWLPR